MGKAGRGCGLLVLSFVMAGILAAAPALGADGRWGADDLRRVMSEWLIDHGRAAPAPSSIGPLDARLSLSACDKLDIAPRGASATSFTLKCSAPDLWQYVLRVDNIQPLAAAVVARAPEADAAGSWHVIVPRVELPAGAILTEDVLEDRVVNVSPGSLAIKSIKEAVGLRLTAPIGPGLMLTTRNVSRTPLVAKGENVTLVANGSGFEIVVPGRAEQDGYEGELIVVRNLRTGAVIKGRVEKNKIVSVLQM